MIQNHIFSTFFDTLDNDHPRKMKKMFPNSETTVILIILLQYMPLYKPVTPSYPLVKVSILPDTRTDGRTDEHQILRLPTQRAPSGKLTGGYM